MSRPEVQGRLMALFVPCMMDIKYVWIVTLLVFFGNYSALAQTDTALTLQTITIRDAYFLNTGFASWHADSLPTAGAGSLAERLLWENPLTVRATGPGTLATVSARGTGPSHTPVFWQGLNLQNPMHGVVDVALLPLWPGDAVEVKYGGQSAFQSSGAMGGAVYIKPAAWSEHPGWSGSVGMGAGSFGRWEGQAAAEYAGQNGGSTIRAAWQKAENDFPFRNTAIIGTPEVRQRNNFGEKFDLQQFNRLKISDKNSLETSIWYQRAYREIPPTMTAAPTDTWQRDHALRAVATWNQTVSGRSAWQHRLAWLDESIDFYLYGTTENSRSRTAIAASEFFTAIGPRLTLKTGLTGWWQQAKADGYADSTNWFQQRRLAGTAMAEYRWKTIRVSASARQEWAENQAAPFTWSLGGHWQLPRQFALRLHVSRNFNLPTFNDRFWRALGNPDLKPEQGYSADAGLMWKRGGFSAEFTTFQILLDDWILWQPGPDGLSRPGNLRQVWSRGTESSASWLFTGLGSRWKIQARHQFVRATNTAIYSANTGSLYKQLPYTPQHSGSIMAQWTLGEWSAAYLHQWTGSRFRLADNSLELPGFHTGSLLFKYDLKWLQQQISLHFRLENCWNSAYQILEYQPMPGRSWRGGVQWAF
jgi:vitamin B12 transporter